MQKLIFIVFFSLTALVFIAAPILAVPWVGHLFPGFMVEQTNVVTDLNGVGWTGRQLGISHPQRVTHVNDVLVQTPAEMNAIVQAEPPTPTLIIRTVLPDGTPQEFFGVRRTSFSSRDLLRLFVLPYTVGLVYLVMAAWVFYLRRDLLPTRIFVYFSLNTAIVLATLFDLSSTHRLITLWSFSVAQLGGALCSLALVFPVIPHWMEKRIYLRTIPYMLSAALVLWSLLTVYDYAQPWAYIDVWRASYYFSAFSIAFFIILTATRLSKRQPALARQQARVILLGALIAFVPITLWFAAPLLNITVRWNPAIFVPLLLIFPTSIALAIHRYRLWDFDAIVNRILVYSILTIALVFVYIVITAVVQVIFFNIMGRSGLLSTIISTLVVVILFNPLRLRIQASIDRRFYRQKHDAARTLQAFNERLRQEVDFDRITVGLLQVIQDTMQPTFVDIHNIPERQPPSSHDRPTLSVLAEHLRRLNRVTSPDEIELDTAELKSIKDQGVRLLVPLVCQEKLVGIVLMGPRLSGQMYSGDDRRLLEVLATQAASSLHMANLVKVQKTEALERQTIENELRLAALVQQTQLPHVMPDLPGWCFASHYQPARATGGDFYDLISLPDGRLGVTIGDVTDKGMPSALVMAQTRSLLRAAALQFTSPGQVLTWVNQLLQPDIPEKMFATCIYAILDPQTGHLCFANAGHNLPLRTDHRTVSTIRARGFPLGLLPGSTYEECETTLQSGDCVLFYSDGLVEAHNTNREMLGEERLMEMVLHMQAADTAVPQLLEFLSGFTGPNWDQEDDITLVAFQHLGGSNVG